MFDMFVDDWNPPLSHLKSMCHLMLVRVVHIWFVRAFPQKMAACWFCLIKPDNAWIKQVLDGGVLDGGQKDQVLERAIEAADGSDKALVTVQKAFGSLMRLHCVSIQFNFLDFIQDKKRWTTETKASFSKRGLASRAEFTPNSHRWKKPWKSSSTRVCCAVSRLAIKKSWLQLITILSEDVVSLPLIFPYAWRLPAGSPWWRGCSPVAVRR